MELKIYNQSGAEKATVSPASSSGWSREVGVENVVSLSFKTWSFFLLDVNDYILLGGSKFRIRKEYRPKQISTQEYDYRVNFYGREHDAEDIKLCRFNQGDDDLEVTFAYEATPLEMLTKVVQNLNRNTDGTVWKAGEALDAPRQTFEFNDAYCWDALNDIASQLETEWWLDGDYINLCKCERGESISLGYMQGLTSLTQQENSNDVRFFTRLIPRGSTKNIDRSKYGFDHLQLPSRAKYLDLNTKLGLKEYVEETAFAEIYPHRTGTISAVRSEEKENEETGKFTVYYIKDKDLPFNPDEHMLDSQVIHITFQSGNLQGKDFECNWHKDNREFEIVNTYPDENSQLPGGNLIPAIGNTYILWNLRMPDEYITAAERDYETAVTDFLSEYARDTSVYQGSTDYIYVDKNSVPLVLGQRVRLLSPEYFDETGYRDSRITRISCKLENLGSATIDCCNATGRSWKSSVESSLSNMKYTIAEQLKQGIIKLLKTGDTEAPSEYNAFTSARTVNEITTRALSKLKPDATNFLLSLLGGAVFGKDGFASGLTGFGAMINALGYGEMRGLRLWEFLEVPELRFNRVEVYIGVKWRVPGAGIVESVEIDTDADGNELSSGTVTLKLEEGEIGAVSLDDIALGIYHYENPSDNAGADTDDSKGNFSFAGFGTSYFRVTEVVGEKHNQFRYSLRPGFKLHPRPQMHFSCYGNFTNKDRQTSTYETRTYTRMLWKQNTWEISAGNIAMQQGDLSNLNIHGMRMEGYSMYLNSVYFTGTITQVKPDGTPIRTANEREEWVSGRYDYYDRVSHNGCIWLCVDENGTDTEPSTANPAWLLQVDKGDKGEQGEQGEGYTQLGRWYTGLLVPKMGVVSMGGSTYAAKVATRNPPLWCYTDHSGERLIYRDGGYILTGDVNTTEYDLWAEKGQDGKDGKDGAQGLQGLQGKDGEKGIPGLSGADGKTTYFHIKYSASSDGSNMSETPGTYIGTYTDFTPDDSTNPSDYAWARFQGLQGTKGEQGIPGYNGVDGKTYYLHIKYSDDGGKTFTGNNGEDSGAYIGVMTDLNPNDSNTPSDYRWSEIKGEKGEGYTQVGRWYTGLLVPKMGVVTMGGGSYVAKVATRNPPLWCFIDSSGNRLTYRDGGYILTGEVNTAEYDVWAEKGDTGNDGKDGADGKPGVDGKPGATGKQGIDGCVIRDSEWAVGVEYRNDSAITDGSLPVRYVDTALVRNNATETGWDAYRCLKTHVSSGSITYANTSYWQKFGANVSAVFTSLVIAKNAKINFLQGNQLLIQKTDGTVTAGLSGSDAGQKIRIWAGSPNPDEAPFRVSESGELVATKANITGTITAEKGTIGGFSIGSNYIGSTNMQATNTDNIRIAYGGIEMTYWLLKQIDGHLYSGLSKTVLNPGSISISKTDDNASTGTVLYARFGKYILSVGADGIRKSTNGGSTWIDL